MNSVHLVTQEKYRVESGQKQAECTAQSQLAHPALRPRTQRPGRTPRAQAERAPRPRFACREPRALPRACRALPPALRARASPAPPRPCRPRLLPAACSRLRVRPGACLRAPACCLAQPSAQPSALSYCNTVCVLQYKSFLFKQQQSRYNVCIVTQPASPAKPACNTIIFIAIYF